MIIRDRKLITRENTDKIYNVIQIINEKGIKYYDKNWHKVHKELKLPQNRKMKFSDFGTNSQIMTQPKDKRRKPVPKLMYATVDYNDIKYYVSYNRRTEEYEISSYFDSYEYDNFAYKEGNIIHKEQKKEINLYNSVF